MKATKKLIVLISVLCMMVCMSACTGNTSAPEVKPLEIEFWHALTGGNEEALTSIVNNFNSENEDVNVKLVYQGHYKELFQKLDGAAQADQLPELTMIFPNRMTAYIMNGFAEDLTNYINNPEIGFTKEDIADIPSVFMKGIWDGKTYTLPCNKSAYELFYNEDMLAEKDIEIPTTWEKLRDASKKLTVDTDNDGVNDIVGLAINRSAGIDFSFWVEQAGGHLLSEDESTLLFNSDAGIEAFNFVSGMANDGILKIVNEDKYAYAPFARKEAAMIITSTSKVPALQDAIGDSDLKWNAAELPSHKNKAVLFTGTDMAMFNTHTDEEKLAAWKFMKYFMSKEQTVKWGMNSGYLPLRYSALDSEAFKEFMKENPSKAVAVKSFEYGFRDPKVLNGYSIHSNMQKALEEVLQGVKTSKEALDDAKDQARKELDEAKKNFGK